MNTARLITLPKLPKCCPAESAYSSPAHMLRVELFTFKYFVDNHDLFLKQVELMYCSS